MTPQKTLTISLCFLHSLEKSTRKNSGMHPKNILNQAPLGGVHNQTQHPQNPKHPSSTPQAPSGKIRVKS
jgi:hypothetical protein